ncbi:nucleotide-diphospho-sugar transferase [Leptolyngbya boryana NIES-2135]|jgi:cellulose synthase (UDP-forming)|uniref:Nucleotide-diphospho-sugar transferase n=1 Tax=Leptolyngbya boryana NIES-2135 TaxID=1973484 RepID=A0A1Z4JFN7_LEPBY|nr:MULTISPECIES: cellulose synthase catalytic subunit [Leptolyngbya]BAY55317.1 nucleotide-diphospho-sugar transferase [Leptolyngbya boryana NIES-2135]MBD2369399.1 glycosyltransferase [Leptolyngbya sp. FACHB-161]MBD2375599.1 glycosyltransferase [Leptolyngbya sp. FACHB-238]MBD2401728.1 glycosyltransferase [Leptolyngbya sp. FACHB-239]MBD2406533.1 glycosyltransferase [Leptolyngbya sp. FACHB-402]
MTYLPTVPSDDEKYAYSTPNGRWIGFVGAIGLTTFAVTSISFISKHPALLGYGVFCLIYFANVGFCAIGAWFARNFNALEHEQVRSRFSDYVPTVDVYLPNCGEDIQVLVNQFKAVKQLDYPNFKVYVLDDAGRDEVRIAAELHSFEYMSRPNKGELKKAGNMRHAFARSQGALILVFDADFAPRPDFLAETVAYFARNPKLAILQTPQYFQSTPEQTAIANGATFLQEVFYRLIQNFRNAWGASVCCGSNAIYRREALAPHGGAAAVERSEDVNTGMMVLRDGWTIEYLPLCLAKGLSPDTVKGFFNQQYRWCSGSKHLITSRQFWTQPNVNLLTKFSYVLSILYYSTSGLGILCFPLPSLINVWFYPQDLSAGNYSLVFPAIAVSIIARGVWAKNRWGLPVLTTSIAASYAHLSGIIDVLGGNVAPWVPTGATGAKSTKYDRFIRMIAFIPPALLALMVLGLAIHDVPWRSETVPLLWMSLQVVLSWLVLREIRTELEDCG